MDYSNHMVGHTESAQRDSKGDFMGLRINTNVASINAQRNLSEVSSRLAGSLEKLSSGKRINRAGDDAAGLATSQSLLANLRGTQQATKNANDGISLVQIAEGGLNETTNILIRLRELAIQGASDSVGDTEKGYLDEEYQQLVSEVDRISRSTRFNGIDLLTGESGTGVMDFQVGPTGEVLSRIQFDPNRANATIGSGGLEIEGTAVNEKEIAQSSLSVIDTALQRVNGIRASFGAMQSRFQSAINNSRVSYENQSAAYSRITDADIALETSEYTRNMLVSQAATSVLANANEYQTLALKLI
jgi:flagellin